MEMNEETDIMDIPLEKRKHVVLEAIRNGEYEIEIEGPDNFISMEHPDGTEFYVLRDDDETYGVSSGYCRITIEGLSFECDLNSGIWSGVDKHLLEDDDVMAAICAIDGVIFGEHNTTYDRIAIYEAVNNCKVKEYYGCWDDRIPLDACDIKGLDEKKWLTALEFHGTRFFLDTNSINVADEEHDGCRWAVSAYGTPDNYGEFKCKEVLLEGNSKKDILDEVIIGIMDSDETMDQRGCFG